MNSCIQNKHRKICFIRHSRISNQQLMMLCQIAIFGRLTTIHWVVLLHEKYQYPNCSKCILNKMPCAFNKIYRIENLQFRLVYPTVIIFYINPLWKINLNAVVKPVPGCHHEMFGSKHFAMQKYHGYKYWSQYRCTRRRPDGDLMVLGLSKAIISIQCRFTVSVSPMPSHNRSRQQYRFI